MRDVVVMREGKGAEAVEARFMPARDRPLTGNGLAVVVTEGPHKGFYRATVAHRFSALSGALAAELTRLVLVKAKKPSWFDEKALASFPTHTRYLFMDGAERRVIHPSTARLLAEPLGVGDKVLVDGRLLEIKDSVTRLSLRGEGFSVHEQYFHVPGLAAKSKVGSGKAEGKAEGKSEVGSGKAEEKDEKADGGLFAMEAAAPVEEEGKKKKKG